MYDVKPKGKKSNEKRKRKINLGRIPMSTRAPKIIESKKRKYEKDQNARELKEYIKK